jgi:hypothetical protein
LGGAEKEGSKEEGYLCQKKARSDRRRKESQVNQGMKVVDVMANFANALKAEINKTNRREAKGVIQEIRGKNASLRRLVAELRTRVFILERKQTSKGDHRKIPGRSGSKAQCKPSKVR